MPEYSILSVQDFNKCTCLHSSSDKDSQVLHYHSFVKMCIVFVHVEKWGILILGICTFILVLSILYF